MASSRWHNKSLEPTAERLSATIKAYLRRLNSIVMLPAPELCLVKVVGKGALGVVGSRGDQYKNLHNITNHCTRPYVRLFISSKASDRG